MGSPAISIGRGTKIRFGISHLQKPKPKRQFTNQKTNKKEVGLHIEQYDKNGQLIFSGSALQGFPLNLHGAGTLFDKDGNPMASTAFYREKQTTEEFLFHPVDNSQTVSILPKFPGGKKAFKIEIAQNVRYPVIAQKNNKTGTIYLKFIIGKNGKMEHFEPARPAIKVLENEGIQTLKRIKKRWQPAESNGTKTEVWHYAKIAFSQFGNMGINTLSFF
jgi:hypothetical protein